MPGTPCSPFAPVYVIGAPSYVGGADTELWHTLRLWRSNNLEVALVPTWGLSEEWRKKCEGIGCEVHLPGNPQSLLDVPGLRGSIVVSFCNKHFLENASSLRQIGCKTVWLNCMTWMFDDERKHYRTHGPFDHYVFQSKYQQWSLTCELENYGYCDASGSVIHGAFDLEAFPFRPLLREPGAPFVIGRISRPDPDKYSSNTWPIYSRMPQPLRARLMAWDRRIEKKLGTPPEWAECLEANRETPQLFFGKLHCMVQINGGAAENWPRSGLEAMASGVPLVVQNEWGWREMVRHDETGYLCNNDDEFVSCATKLANDDGHRLTMARLARKAMEEDLANPDVIWERWSEVFRRLG
jgi:hypothetical protein